jgi:hypothetical protein
MREEEPHLSYLLSKILPLASTRARARRLVALRVLKRREMLGLLLLRKKVEEEVRELLRQRSTVLLVLDLQA